MAKLAKKSKPPYSVCI